MIVYAVLSALALLGLGEARTAAKPSPKFHISLTTKMVSHRPRNGEPVRQSSAFLVGRVSMGTPRQELEVLFDLGSPEMIVPSTNTTSNHCGKYHCFNGSASSTFKNTGVGYEQDYVAGSNRGVIALDEVQVGNLVVSKQAFLNCYKMDAFETRVNFGFHGIIGLSYSYSWPGADRIGSYSPPLVYNAKAQGSTKKEEIAILYSRGKKDGKLTIGGWDENLVSEDKIRWLENAQLMSIYWGLTGIKDISAGARGMNKSAGPVDGGIGVDSGNPGFLSVPENTMDALNEVFQYCGYDLKNPGEVKLSEVDDKLPTLTFDIQGHTFSLKPSQYVLSHDDCPEVQEGHGKVAIRTQDMMNFAGGVFLRNFYTIYDFENQRMGLVPLADIEG